MDQGCICAGWALDEAIEEVLKISNFDEDDLYQALDWICENCRG